MALVAALVAAHTELTPLDQEQPGREIMAVLV
jgi:hypothetical protein